MTTGTLLYPIKFFAVVGKGEGGHREQGAEQENSYTNYAVINRLPLTAMLGTVNEASRWNGLRSRTATRISSSK